MPGAVIRPADFGRDNAALCALARRCPQGGALSFYHERADFRERGRLQPHVETLVTEEAGTIMGCGSVARKPLWLGGSPYPTAYVFDLMVDPARRGRGIARDLLRGLVDACPGASLVYAHILDDNRASRRLFERQGFRAHRRRLKFHAILPSREGRASRAVVGPVLIDAAEAADIDGRLRKRYVLADETAGHDGLFRLETPDGRAWAALRRHGAKVAVSVPWPPRALGRLMPLFPRPGRPVVTWSLHHIGAEGRRPGAALDRLLRGAAGAARREGIDLLLVPLFDDDPLNVSLRRYLLPRWGLGAGATRLYVRGRAADAVLRSARPLLLSGRDG
ncbi:MAG TPA: GNAT family N-acetyltransferase [Gemmataceae bacterium]|nr:GNAT family N-acetyltransferase [Gemmataceae bacterium]